MIFSVISMVCPEFVRQRIYKWSSVIHSLFHSTKMFWEFPVGPVVKIWGFHFSRCWDWSLVWELRSCMLCGEVKKKKKKKLLGLCCRQHRCMFWMLLMCLALCCTPMRVRYLHVAPSFGGDIKSTRLKSSVVRVSTRCLGRPQWKLGKTSLKRWHLG